MDLVNSLHEFILINFSGPLTQGTQENLGYFEIQDNIR